MHATRENLGFLLAKASQRWNELLAAGFRRGGFPQVRPAYGSVLLPLFEEDGLRLSELAARSRLSKQAMTTLVRTLEARRLIVRRPDPDDGRATRVYLTPRARRFQATAEHVLATLDRRAEQRLSRDRLDGLRDAVKTLMALSDEPPGSKGDGI
jgi:DNA-binding MarR family transcriptional regulator